MSENQNDEKLVRFVAELREKMFSQLHQRIIGQDKTLDLILVTLLARGHSLVTGVPGLAKTLLVNSLAEVLELNFSRIQFTPDLMPSDVTGTEVVEEVRTTGRRDFKFVRGPVFSNLLLADEVNRTPPKTQAALLQAMQEYQVTATGKTYTLSEPFHVFATQNPIEQEGTYPLPEALLDRFLLSIHMEYPSREEEIAIVKGPRAHWPSLKCIAGPEQLLEAQKLVNRVPVGDHVVEFVVHLVRSTRPGDEAPGFVNDYVSWGAGPRAAQCLLAASRAWALLQGNPSPRISDVVEMAPAVLRHRIVLNFRAETERVHKDKLIAELSQEAGS
jgi:MoxR-like ATPase